MIAYSCLPIVIQTCFFNSQFNICGLAWTECEGDVHWIQFDSLHLACLDTIILIRVELLLSRLAGVLKPKTREIHTSISERADGVLITRKAVRECGRRLAVEHGRRCLVLTHQLLLLLLLLQKGLLKVRRRRVDDTGSAIHGHGRVERLRLSPTGPAIDVHGCSECLWLHRELVYRRAGVLLH